MFGFRTDVIAHHPLTAHGSLPNTSQALRRGLSARYMGKDVRYRPRASVPVKLGYDCAPGEYPADDEKLPLVALG